MRNTTAKHTATRTSAKRGEDGRATCSASCPCGWTFTATRDKARDAREAVGDAMVQHIFPGA